MTPTASWPSLVLSFTLLFSPLATSIPLPVPAKDSNCNNLNPSSSPETGLQPRSPIPDPVCPTHQGPPLTTLPTPCKTKSKQTNKPQRLIPSQTDGVARILAGLGLEKLASLNKLNPEEDAWKQKQKQEQAQEQEQAEKAQDAIPIDDSQSDTPTVTAHDNEPTTDSQPANSQPADEQPGRAEPVQHGTNTESTESAKPMDNGKAKDPNTLNPATDTDGYLQSLFEKLKSKIREAFNSSDEITLH